MIPNHLLVKRISEAFIGVLVAVLALLAWLTSA